MIEKLQSVIAYYDELSNLMSQPDAMKDMKAFTKMAKEHNNANVLCLGSRVIGVELAKTIVDTWLVAKFEGGRHSRRVDMFDQD